MVSCAPIVNRCSRAQPGPGVSTFSNSDKTAGSAGGLAAGVLCAPIGWSHVGQASWPVPAGRSPTGALVRAVTSSPPNVCGNCGCRLPSPVFQFGFLVFSPCRSAVSRAISSFAILPAAEFPSMAVTFPMSSATDVLASVTAYVNV